MNLHITRDSVCAGDDGNAPHAREFSLPDGGTVDDLIRHAVRVYALPSISGGKAAWALSSIEPLAVVAQEWAEPRLLKMLPPELAALDVVAGTLRLHFSYFAQADPQAVFDVLRVRAE